MQAQALAHSMQALQALQSNESKLTVAIYLEQGIGYVMAFLATLLIRYLLLRTCICIDCYSFIGSQAQGPAAVH